MLESFSNSIMEYVFVPIIVAFGAALLLIFKNKFDKISKSIVAKNEIASIEKKSSIRKELMTTIATSVEAAVASNMQLADAMKEGGHQLTDEEVSQLNKSAKSLIINSLPESLTEQNGVLCEIIGGRDRLDAIVDAMIEKYVYEYKVKNMQAQSTPIIIEQPTQAPVQTPVQPKSTAIPQRKIRK